MAGVNHGWAQQVLGIMPVGEEFLDKNSNHTVEKESLLGHLFENEYDRIPYFFIFINADCLTFDGHSLFPLIIVVTSSLYAATLLTIEMSAFQPAESRPTDKLKSNKCHFDIKFS